MKNYYYFIEIQYLGFRYHGWQKQNGVKTVQGMVEKTLNFIFDHDNFKTLAAGRTDAMVSVNQSAFELFLREPIDKDKLLVDLNFNLPADIKVLSIKEIDQQFNIIQHAKLKEYLYLFSYGKKNHPFCAPFMSYINTDLNIDIMKTGAALFAGNHNFRQYVYKPNEAACFEREVLISEIVDNNIYTASFFPSDSYIFRVKGSGFLRYQVRLMMGTLFRLGKGEIVIEDIIQSLKGEKNEIIGYIAPSSGLILNEVQFE
ncbi:MAG: tRNA pseudouridine(38-40) synthase TruA [Cyclobacteriaceae bacterium]|nr:tRNA pseudouridine(38-40) synthase TruA [Cyclobacteriaceae bacterium]